MHDGGRDRRIEWEGNEGEEGGGIVSARLQGRVGLAGRERTHLVVQVLCLELNRAHVDQRVLGLALLLLRVEESRARHRASGRGGKRGAVGAGECVSSGSSGTAQREQSGTHKGLVEATGLLLGDGGVGGRGSLGGLLLDDLGRGGGGRALTSVHGSTHAGCWWVSVKTRGGEGRERRRRR